MKTLIRILTVLLGGLLATAAMWGADSPAAAAVRRADAARCAAMMRGDGPGLDALMSDELRFVHSDGRVETKVDYVKNMMAGDTAYTGVKTSDVQALEPAPGVVILIGAQEMRKRLGAAWSDIKLRYMAVWRNESGTWRMYAWLSMKPSGSSVVPGKK